MNKYDDILETKWPIPSHRAPMNLNLRAKIFLPFAALTGYDKALDETLKNEIQNMESKAGLIQFDDIPDFDL